MHKASDKVLSSYSFQAAAGAAITSLNSASCKKKGDDLATRFDNLRNLACGGCDATRFHNLRSFPRRGCEATRFHNLRNFTCGGCEAARFHSLRNFTCAGCETTPIHNLGNSGCRNSSPQFLDLAPGSVSCERLRTAKRLPRLGGRPGGPERSDPTRDVST